MVRPPPGVSCGSSVPPIASVRPRDSASPSPTPPGDLLVSPSRWNGRNARPHSVRGMPGPRSTTLISTRSPWARAVSSGGVPGGEYRKAQPAQRRLRGGERAAQVMAERGQQNHAHPVGFGDVAGRLGGRQGRPPAAQRGTESQEADRQRYGGHDGQCAGGRVLCHAHCLCPFASRPGSELPFPIRTVTQRLRPDKSDGGCGAIGTRYTHRVNAPRWPVIGTADGSIANAFFADRRSGGQLRA
jgi:hypothetical protein